MKKNNEKETTTVSLSITDNQRLTQICKAYSIPKKDFIGIILNYLEINGINPKTHHAPKTELEKITKRINQLFAFIKTQEKDYTRPALEAVLATENRIQNSFSTLATKNDFDEVATMLMLSKLAKLLLENQESESTKVIKELKDFLSEAEIKRKEFELNVELQLEEIKKKRGISF
ncbi:BfmA/BtgA family mobilization protein [Myroides odoratimimus]|uniref:BfmA/BtgA family mobilization protein n=1 Tax=Myroides odoratimimus TaxID=76832 RepID=UPI00257671B4|nr:BfmA/BtgA family mobilization protein [Myroides odoratimimus]MDM1514117.1 hypothetical protein [Myroides odoratimimus]